MITDENGQEWERISYDDRIVRSMRTTIEGKDFVTHIGMIGEREVWHPERFALTYQSPDWPNTTIDLPDLGCWSEDAVVAIEGKHHWALIEGDGDIRIVRKDKDGCQVLYIEEVSGSGMPFPITGNTYRYSSESTGNYADHARSALQRIDSEAEHFIKEGQKSVNPRITKLQSFLDEAEEIGLAELVEGLEGAYEMLRHVPGGSGWNGDSVDFIRRHLNDLAAE